MCDYHCPNTAYCHEAPINISSESSFQNNSNEQGWILYEPQDLFLYEPESLMCKPPKSEENPSQPSESKEAKPHNAQAIIPDYLLKKIQEHHQSEEASPDVIEQDQRNREESEKLRKQRMDNSPSPSEDT